VAAKGLRRRTGSVLCPIEADWPETAWNGVALRHPASWEVIRLDRDQLLWSEGSHPVLEIRWALYRGRFDPRRALHRFGRRARRKGLPQPEPWSPPQSWRTSLDEFHLAGFCWRHTQTQGYGLLAYCPHCRRQNLIQFHPHLMAQPDLVPVLLASLRDHARRDEDNLSIFGIRARLPCGVQLLRFRFETGRYHLHWRFRRYQLGLYRWAPAGIILAREPLSGFAAAQFQVAEEDLTPLRQTSFVGIEGNWSSGAPLFERFGLYRSRRMLRVWHVTTHNCLLGIEVHGRGKGLNALIERLCDSYGCI
jgi:hypothetical protein